MKRPAKQEQMPCISALNETKALRVTDGEEEAKTWLVKEKAWGPDGYKS